MDANTLLDVSKLEVESARLPRKLQGLMEMVDAVNYNADTLLELAARQAEDRRNIETMTNILEKMTTLVGKLAFLQGVDGIDASGRATDA